MTAPIIQADYDQLKQIAARFKRQAQSTNEMHRGIQSNAEPLQSGGWLGRGIEAFSAEMEGDLYPAIERLTASLSEASVVVIHIIDLLQNAEEEAARPFGGGRWELPEGGAPADGEVSILPVGPPAAEVTQPPPRIYIVNGINSAGTHFQNGQLPLDGNGNPIIGDNQSVYLEQLLEEFGYDPAQVTSTQAIYIAPQGTDLTGTDLNGTDLEGTDLSGTDHGGWLSPIDWVTGAGASAIDAVTGTGADAINAVTGAGAGTINVVTETGADVINATTGVLIENSLVGSGYGSYEVLQEYMQGPDGQYTQMIHNEIMADLAANPLAPGQTIILMGHSGGGAVTANLSGTLEGEGYDVSGMVTMGSPVSNYDYAAQYADLVVDVSHEADAIVNIGPLGTPIIRSEESQWGIPVSIIAGQLPGVSTIGTFATIEAGGRLDGAPSNVAEIQLTGTPTDEEYGGHGAYMHEWEPGQTSGISVDMIEQLNELFPTMNLDF